jgi:hypothetical protein
MGILGRRLGLKVREPRRPMSRSGMRRRELVGSLKMRRRAHFARMVIAETEKESRVTDLVFTLVTIGFFLVAIGYLRGCERLR